MKNKISFLLLTALLFGCSEGDPHFRGYKVASGDLGPFVLDSATSYGAHPLKVGGLPKLEAEWRYKADKDGIQIYIVGDRFPEVQSLLLAAFGPPAIAPKTNANGGVSMGVYAASTAGAGIQFLHADTPDGSHNTQVLIVRSGALKP